MYIFLFDTPGGNRNGDESLKYIEQLTSLVKEFKFINQLFVDVVHLIQAVVMREGHLVHYTYQNIKTYVPSLILCLTFLSCQSPRKLSSDCSMNILMFSLMNSSNNYQHNVLYAERNSFLNVKSHRTC